VRGAKHFALRFSLETGLLPWAHGPAFGLDSVRLALPRPPNLEMQYQRMRKPCQVKNAKCGLTFSYCVYL
jgi:hypothetical protein